MYCLGEAELQLRSSTIGLRDGNFNLKDEKLQWPSSNDEYGLYQGYAENPRYADEQEIIDATNISRKTVNNHLTKMGYINRWSLGSTAIDKPTLWIASLYTIFSSNDMKEIFLKRLVTGDETWIFYQNMHRKCIWFKNIRDCQPLRSVDFIWRKFFYPFGIGKM